MSENKNMSYHINNGIQFQIKNTFSGNWFVDLQKREWVDDHPQIHDIYMHYESRDKFRETIEEAIQDAVFMLNIGEFTSIKREK